MEGGRQEWQGLGEDATGASTHRIEAAWTTRCWERQDDAARSGIQFGLIGFTEESDMRCDRKRGIKQHLIFRLCVCWGQSPRMNEWWCQWDDGVARKEGRWVWRPGFAVLV